MRRPHSAFAVLGTCLAVETLVVSPPEQWGFYAKGAEDGRRLRETCTNRTSTFDIRRRNKEVQLTV